MAFMGYDGVEAVNALNTAIANNDELNQLFSKANNEVFNAFNAEGGVVGGILGQVCANIWGNGSRDFFQKELMKKTEFFLMDKVLPIIKASEGFTNETVNAYATTLEETKAK